MFSTIIFQITLFEFLEINIITSIVVAEYSGDYLYLEARVATERGHLIIIKYSSLKFMDFYTEEEEKEEGS